jgi:hypothetical protein
VEFSASVGSIAAYHFTVERVPPLNTRLRWEEASRRGDVDALAEVAEIRALVDVRHHSPAIADRAP